MEMLPVSHKPTKPPDSFRIMATHPTSAREDPGAIDDRGPRGGHLRSNEVTIRFWPISRARIRKQTRKWCQTAWFVEPLR